MGKRGTKEMRDLEVKRRGRDTGKKHRDITAGQWLVLLPPPDEPLTKQTING